MNKPTTARFNVFGRKILEIERRDGRWIAYYPGTGLRRRADFVIPEALENSELETYLADLFHELATPEQNQVTRI